MDSGEGSDAARSTHRPPATDDGAEPTPERPFLYEHPFILRSSRYGPRYELVRGRFAGRSQASYSAAPPNLPTAERTGSGTRHRRLRHRRQTQHVEHSGEVSRRGLEVTNLPSFDALPASGSAGFHSHHPGAEGAVTGTHIRQSVLYSDRPRRPRRTQASLLTQLEHQSEMSSSELSGAVTDLPTLEVLALSDPPPLTHQITGEDTDDDDDPSCYLYVPEDDKISISSSGLTTEMLRSLGDSIFSTVSMEEMQKMRRPEDIDTEELRRKIKEYYDKNPPVSLKEAFDSILAVQYATLTALAAEKGIEPPRNPFLVDQEAPSFQAQQEDSAPAAHPQDSMVISHEASTGVIQDGKQWMRDEVTLCFRKHVEKTPYLAGLVFELDELCHQCFNVENYMKVFHHYNFKIKMKMPASVEWIVELYFGEVKEIFGRKFYFCCPLEPNESGHCYACKKQGVEDLKHPVTGGFEIGLPDDETDGDNDEEAWGHSVW